MPAAAPKRKPSVLKRARQTEVLELRNKAVRSKVKTLAKKVLEAINGKDAAVVSAALTAAVKAISSAASKGVLHKSTASRKISRLSIKANSVLKPTAA